MTCNLVVGSHWCVDTSSYLSWKEVTPRIKPDLLGFSWIWGPMKRRSVWAWICWLKVGPKGCTRCNYCPQIKTFNLFLEVSGRYLEGTHWVYGKKTMWSILDNGMSALVSIWLSEMLCWLLCCVSLFSNTWEKSFRGVYIDDLWTGNTFSLYSCP